MLFTGFGELEARKGIMSLKEFTTSVNGLPVFKAIHSYFPLSIRIILATIESIFAVMLWYSTKLGEIMGKKIEDV